MGSYYSEADSHVPTSNSNSSPFLHDKNPMKDDSNDLLAAVQEEEGEEMGMDCKVERDEGWPRKGGVTLEGYVDGDDGGDGGSEGSVGRTKSLTDEDLEELKGCLDLGFGFSYEEIPELCNTLPALELCYSMSQRFLDESDGSGEAAEQINWRISGPGDDPEEVKARLRYWAQTVACTVRLCN
ncbi:uncharacterized protein [Typha latifolia]|uniref:uncharacterized protein n=1 Tax=Typha latifolia TaxID=4733 RepID=UPI003C2EAD2B